MADINKKKVENILSLPNQDRYDYFIRKAADFEEVWSLYNEGWALLDDSNGNELIPFWPEEVFANLCATDQWQSYKPRSIDMESFLTKWLPGMEKDGKNVSIFYLSKDNKGIITIPKDLIIDLQKELEQYE